MISDYFSNSTLNWNSSIVTIYQAQIYLH